MHPTAHSDHRLSNHTNCVKSITMQLMEESHGSYASTIFSHDENRTKTYCYPMTNWKNTLRLGLLNVQEKFVIFSLPVCIFKLKIP